MAIKTILEDVRWTITVYPWESNYPSHDVTKIFNDVPPIELREGVLSVQLHRSKDNPYGVCNFNFFGPIPSQLFIGNWVLIKSYNGKNESSDDGVVRFFGQIYNLKTSYQVNQGSGGLSQYTMVAVREWSFLYSVPVRYDSYAFLNTIEDPQLKFLASAQTIAKEDGRNIRFSEIGKTITNPFEFCAMVLAWIGSLSRTGMKTIESGSEYNNHFIGAKLADMQLPDVALLMPKIPMRLLKDLGVSNEDLKNPFRGDFVTQVFGVLDKRISEFDSDAGVFNADVLSKSYTEARNRPAYSNIMSVFVNGESAWQLLSQNCDTAVNEVFTDLYYYRSGNKVITRPLIMFRDKPFILESNKATEELSTNWSTYDAVPRTTIQTEQIERVDLDHSFTNCPNYIRVQYMPENGWKADEMRVRAELNSTFRLVSEMLRYGGQTSYLQTPFAAADGGYLPNWYRDLATLHAHWEGLRYRTPGAQLIIRDTNTCYTVGMNIRFPIGKNVFVGHLTNVSITYSRNSEGTHRTTTVLSLDRLVMELPTDSNKLAYIPEELINNIYYQNAKIEPVRLDVTKNIFKAIDKAAAQLNKLKNQARNEWKRFGSFV
jgi:hypothetical protein